MQDLAVQLKSRKFWIAAVSIAYFMLNNDANNAMYTALAYIGVQGAVDHAQTKVGQ